MTIEIKYEKLFKHCSTCVLMTHEKGLCLTLDTRNQPQAGRGDVFSRVQLPPAKEEYQSSLDRTQQPWLVNDRTRELRKDDGRSSARYQNSRPYRDHNK